MDILKQKIKGNILLFLLIVISTLVCYKNYTPNTFLSGWDTLHPEFNFQLYFERITQVWQQHQGLGAPPAQAHAAELPRILLLWLTSFILPLNLIRYSYFFLMLIIGPVGVYLFSCYIGSKSHLSKLSIKLGAFLGGLFYLLNIGTMQHFVVPLEMFATKYGYLGLIFLTATRFIDHRQKKDLLLFCLWIILSSAMAHTATLWYVFYLGLAVYAFGYNIAAKRSVQSALLLVGVTLLINLFWILPNLYYGINHGQTMIDSKINRLFTEEAYSYNKKYGNLEDFLIFKNFLFDWQVIDSTGKFNLLLGNWINHFNNQNILVLAYLMSLMAFLGLTMAINKNNKILVNLIPIGIITAIFLLSENHYITPLLEDLRKNQLIRELIRFPFTKFSLYYIFILSLGFSFFHQVIINKITRFTGAFYFYIIGFVIICYGFPAFQGNLISPIVRVSIPQEYFQLFDWSKKQDEGRLLNLPFQSLFGWIYYRFPTPTGYQYYQGGGFTWFGLKQPTLNREFDRWYNFNEENYRELNYAITARNSELFAALLQKYRIKYIMLDENVWFPQDQSQQIKLMYPEIKNIITQLSNLTLEKTFGKISIYKNLAYDSGILLKNISSILPTYSANYIDQAYLDNGDYFSPINAKKNANNITIYPYRQILNRNDLINQQIIRFNDTTYSYQNTQPPIKQFDFSPLKNQEIVVKAAVFLQQIDNRKLMTLKYYLPGLNAQSYLQQISLPNTGEVIGVNNTVFKLPYQWSLQPQYVTEVTIYLNKTNQINLYRKLKTMQLSNYSQLNNLFNCSGTNENQTYGIQTKDGVINVYGHSINVCLDYPFGPTLTDVYSVGVDYLSDYLTNTEICLWDKIKDQCLDNNINITNGSNGFSRLEIFNNHKIIDPVVRFSTDFPFQDQIKNAWFTNLTFQYYHEVDSNQFFFQPILESNESINKAVDNILSHPIDVNVKELIYDHKFCSFERPTEYFKRNVGSVDSPLLEYGVVQGSQCEIINLHQANQNLGYLLAITAENIVGQPFKICLEDDSVKRCILDEQLPRNNNLTTDYYIIPPSYVDNYGYNLLLNNYSIGNEKTVNRLKSIRLIPFPYAFIQSYKQLPDQENNDNVVYFKDIAYEKNWKAYSVPLNIGNNGLLRLFSPLFGTELKDHVLVNNWANGWVISQNQLKSVKTSLNQSGHQQIVIIFLPQYLEFLGFAAGGIALLAIVLKLNRT